MQVKSNGRHINVSADELARKCNLGLETSRDTMSATTRKGVRTSMEPIYRRFKVDHLDLHCKRLKGNWYADALISKVKSILGNNVANIYTQGKFVQVYPITAQREEVQSLIDFTGDYGVPETLLTDGAAEFNGQNTDIFKHARWM